MAHLEKPNEMNLDEAKEICQIDINSKNVWKILKRSLGCNDVLPINQCLDWLKNEPIMTMSQYCQTIINLSS